MKQGCSVFVGNIDFEIDEQRIIEELSAVGKVVSFRLMYDKSTGKSKGYGFCEYESPLIAETAMKTLKIVFNGRAVKINYAENDLPSKPVETKSKVPQIDNIVAALDDFDADNLKEIIEYLKKMAVNQPTQLKNIFDSNPNLVISILGALLKLNLVEPSAVNEVIFDSFDVFKQKDQLAERISNMSVNDLEGFPEEVKAKLSKMKYILAKKM
ncbi:cleavage stimulation factor subunit 2 [Enteropsectra breve]|nr:cleavage stimulation factor subunit 2 [Enteropsectra breve]